MTTDQRIIEKFLENYPQVALPIIESLEIEEIASLIVSLPANQSMVLLSGMVPYRAGKVMEKVPVGDSIKVIELLPLTASTALLRQIDKSVCDQILQGLPEEKAMHFKRTLKYPKELVGAYLDPFMLTLIDDLKVEEGLTAIKKNAAGVKSSIFILDKTKKLVGFVEIKDLLTANPESMIRSVMKAMPRTVLADMSVNDLLDNWDNEFIDLPVVNSEGFFLGSVSRAKLSVVNLEKTFDRSAMKAGNALGDLYLIGLTSLFSAGSDITENPK